MTHTKANTYTADATTMGNGNKKFPNHSSSTGDMFKHSAQINQQKDVARWSSNEVQHWIKGQCKKFELKKATAEKFEMNGQALVLLTKHDFLRRSPDGGEILYYALQQLINPNKFNSARLNQSSSRNRATGPQPRIVEVNGDEGNNTPTDSTSPQPIVEEPDDPPRIQRSPSDPSDYFPPQPPPHPFFFQPPPVMTMSAGSAAAFFHQQQQQQQGFANPMFAAPPRPPPPPPHHHHHHHHHPHAHMHQPHVMHPSFVHQYHPMMSAQGILIEFIDDADPQNQPHGVNGPMDGPQDSLYVVTMNGQRYVMNEDQVRQFVTEVHQRQSFQDNVQQQQQQQQQQQRFFQQQAQQRPFPEQQFFS